MQSLTLCPSNFSINWLTKNQSVILLCIILFVACVTLFLTWFVYRVYVITHRQKSMQGVVLKLQNTLVEANATIRLASSLEGTEPFQSASNSISEHSETMNTNPTSVNNKIDPLNMGIEIKKNNEHAAIQTDANQDSLESKADLKTKAIISSNGIDGKDGKDGIDGKDGKDGPIGLPGDVGAIGPSAKCTMDETHTSSMRRAIEELSERVRLMEHFQPVIRGYKQSNYVGSVTCTSRGESLDIYEDGRWNFMSVQISCAPCFMRVYLKDLDSTFSYAIDDLSIDNCETYCQEVINLGEGEKVISIVVPMIDVSQEST
jgi:hypothetical protein